MVSHLWSKFKCVKIFPVCYLNQQKISYFISLSLWVGYWKNYSANNHQKNYRPMGHRNSHCIVLNCTVQRTLSNILSQSINHSFSLPYFYGNTRSWCRWFTYWSSRDHLLRICYILLPSRADNISLVLAQIINQWRRRES